VSPLGLAFVAREELWRVVVGVAPAGVEPVEDTEGGVESDFALAAPVVAAAQKDCAGRLLRTRKVQDLNTMA